MSYASNMDLGRSLTLADTKFLSQQVCSDLFNDLPSSSVRSLQIVSQADLTEDLLSLQLGNFISMTPFFQGTGQPKP